MQFSAQLEQTDDPVRKMKPSQHCKRAMAAALIAMGVGMAFGARRVRRRRCLPSTRRCRIPCRSPRHRRLTTPTRPRSRHVRSSPRCSTAARRTTATSRIRSKGPTTRTPPCRAAMMLGSHRIDGNPPALAMNTANTPGLRPDISQTRCGCGPSVRPSFSSGWALRMPGESLNSTVDRDERPSHQGAGSLRLCRHARLTWTRVYQPVPWRLSRSASRWPGARRTHRRDGAAADRFPTARSTGLLLDVADVNAIMGTNAMQDASARVRRWVITATCCPT